MKITFYVENEDYLDYVTSTDEHGEVVENHIKPGDILEDVQLHAYFIECWDKVDGKKTKELKHIKLDCYNNLPVSISYSCVISCMYFVATSDYNLWSF